jgi:hypothetical protein
MLIEQTAEWSINGARELLHHTSCQLGNLTRMGFVTQLRPFLSSIRGLAIPPSSFIQNFGGSQAIFRAGLHHVHHSARFQSSLVCCQGMKTDYCNI